MTWIIVAAVIVAIALFVLERRSKKPGPATDGYPYQSTGALFSPGERSFLGVLQQTVGTNAVIFGKVRVADVLEPKTGLGRSAWQKAFNKISGKHFDFLICDKADLSIICAIELDDASHNSKRRHERDEFLKGACEAAGVPLVQFPAKAGYVIDEVRGLLAPHLPTIASPDQEPSLAPAPQKSNGSEKICPNCSASMVKRVAKKGNHAGKAFWACSAYPKCKTIEAIGA